GNPGALNGRGIRSRDDESGDQEARSTRTSRRPHRVHRERRRRAHHRPDDSLRRRRVFALVQTRNRLKQIWGRTPEHCSDNVQVAVPKSVPKSVSSLHPLADEVNSLKASMLNIGFIGFGEAGSCIARGLQAVGGARLFAYDIRVTPQMERRAAEAATTLVS